MRTIDLFHGAVLANLVTDRNLTILKYNKNQSSYIINGSIILYIKYSQKRISPWSFSFSKEHVEDISNLSKEFKQIFIILVCNVDGIVCLKLEELKKLISIENKIFPKWVKSARLKNEKYSISGSDGKLNYKIGNNDFPNKIFD